MTKFISVKHQGPQNAGLAGTQAERAIFTGDRNSLLTQQCIKTIMILTLTTSRSLTAVPIGKKDCF